jgi:hypothetical protein
MKDPQLQMHLGHGAFPQKEKETFLSSCDQFVHNHFLIISGTLVVTYALGILAYGEPFLFFQYAISDLGATVTKHGLPNTTSRIIMTIGMLICSCLMLRIGLYQGRNLRHQRVKRWLAVLCAAGFLFFVCPMDINYTIHSIGAGLMIGCLYLFDNCFLLEQRNFMPALIFWLSQGILQATVLTYAAAYFANALIKQISQKLCIAGLLTISLLSLRGWDRRNRWSQRQ